MNLDTRNGFIQISGVDRHIAEQSSNLNYSRQPHQ